MKLLQIILLCSLTVYSYGQEQNKYDFDESKYKFNTPEELAKSYIETLSDCDTSKILSHCISKEATFYFLDQISKLKKDAQNIDEAIKATDSQFEKGQEQYITATKNLKWNIDKDSIDIKECKIANIEYEVADWYGLKPVVVFTSLNIVLSYKSNEYNVNLAQLVRLKNKWFILGPEIRWQNYSMPVDKTSEQELQLLEKEMIEAMKLFQQLEEQKSND